MSDKIKCKCSEEFTSVSEWKRHYYQKIALCLEAWSGEKMEELDELRRKEKEEHIIIEE